MDKEVALRDANQQFAKYVRAVEAGESFVITRRGKPVARLVPIELGKRVLTPEQHAARQRALERMRRGIDMGGARFNRDDLYERCVLHARHEHPGLCSGSQRGMEVPRGDYDRRLFH